MLRIIARLTVYTATDYGDPVTQTLIFQETIVTYQYISFNPGRSMGVPSVRYIKPEDMFRHTDAIKEAKAVLFPEYWQVNALVHALKANIFPSVATYQLGHDKVEMTRGFLAACPLMVPKTGIYSNASIDFDTMAELFGLPFVCKEVRSSSGLGVFLIDHAEEFNAYIKDNPVVYIQEYLEIDRDLRIVVIGDQVLSAYWRMQAPGCFHNNVARGGRVDKTDIPELVLRQVLEVARELNINHAGFDVAVTPLGNYLLEFNPFFGTRGIAQNPLEMGQLIHQYLNAQFLSRRSEPLQLAL